MCVVCKKHEERYAMIGAMQLPSWHREALPSSVIITTPVELGSHSSCVATRSEGMRVRTRFSSMSNRRQPPFSLAIATMSLLGDTATATLHLTSTFHSHIRSSSTVSSSKSPQKLNFSTAHTSPRRCTTVTPYTPATQNCT